MSVSPGIVGETVVFSVGDEVVSTDEGDGGNEALGVGVGALDGSHELHEAGHAN